MFIRNHVMKSHGDGKRASMHAILELSQSADSSSLCMHVSLSLCFYIACSVCVCARVCVCMVCTSIHMGVCVDMCVCVCACVWMQYRAQWQV